MQVKISDLFEHTDPNGDTVKAVHIGNMHGIVFTIQPKDSTGGVSVALDHDAMRRLRDMLSHSLGDEAMRIIQEAIKKGKVNG